MSLDMAQPAPGLFIRTWRLMTHPAPALDQLAGEEPNPGAALKGHVAPLALLMTLSGLFAAFWAQGFALSQAAMVEQGAAATLRFLLVYFGAFLFGKAIEALAPRFEARPDAGRAMQLSAYSATAFILAGFSMLLGFGAPLALAIGAGYSAVLLYLGLPRFMGPPEHRRGGFFAALLGVAFAGLVASSLAYNAAIGTVRSAYQQLLAAAPEPAPTAPTGPRLLEPGAALDAAALARLGQANSWGGTPIAPEALEGFLPPSLPGGFERGAVSGAAYGGVAQAAAGYVRGQARLTLTITHLGSAGAAAAISAAQDSLRVWQSETGYARHQIANGRLAAERVEGARIDYIVVGNGLAVSVAGEGGADVDDARAAVETIDIVRLEDAFDR